MQKGAPILPSAVRLSDFSDIPAESSAEILARSAAASRAKTPQPPACEIQAKKAAEKLPIPSL
jgi:hypothetical protein